MLTHILAILLVVFLIGREKKSLHGSPALMGVVMVVVFFAGYMGTGYVLLDHLSAEPNFVHDVLMILWLGIGYGVYWLIRKLKDGAYQRRLEAELSE